MRQMTGGMAGPGGPFDPHKIEVIYGGQEAVRYSNSILTEDLRSRSNFLWEITTDLNHW
jgi:hypothetical protein